MFMEICISFSSHITLSGLGYFSLPGIIFVYTRVRFGFLKGCGDAPRRSLYFVAPRGAGEPPREINWPMRVRLWRRGSQRIKRSLDANDDGRWEMRQAPDNRVVAGSGAAPSSEISPQDRYACMPGWIFYYYSRAGIRDNVTVSYNAMAFIVPLSFQYRRHDSSVREGETRRFSYRTWIKIR